MPDQAFSLDSLYEAIERHIRATIAGLEYVSTMPDMLEQISVPAVLIELVEFEPGIDQGTGETALIARFEARVIVGAEREQCQQQAAFAAIGPDKHWNQAHEATVKVITAGLVELGLLRGDVGELIESEAYKMFYMHRAGHWLGMDVHDVGEYKVGGEWRVLEVGMTLTVEPGIYISPDNLDVAKKWRGIGVRIEDDVVVTRQGCEILSGGVPKTVAEIEALMAAAQEQVV